VQYERENAPVLAKAGAGSAEENTLKKKMILICAYSDRKTTIHPRNAATAEP
jgi:hypothetical protein